MQRRFLRKRGAAGSTPSVIAYGDATFPKGTGFFAVAGNFAVASKGALLGELSRSD